MTVEVRSAVGRYDGFCERAGLERVLETSGHSGGRVRWLVQRRPRD